MNDRSRLESIESAAWRDLLEAAPRSERTRLGLWAEAIGDATLIGAAGIDHPLFNRVIGLSGAEGDIVVQRIVESYRRVGVKRYFVHVPEGQAGEALTRALEQQGLTRFHRAWIKLVRGAEPPLHVETELDIVRASIRERAEIGEILTSGFDLPECAAFTMSSVVGRRDWHVYIARDGARVAAVGGVFVRGTAANLAFAATRPEYRRRGAQSALLAKRIRVAIDLGCELMTSETGEAVPFEAQHSFDNMRRHGFRPVYRRENFCPLGARSGVPVVMMQRPMTFGLETFVGRTTELELLRAGVIGATRGNGSGWLVTGEPGIGKTRLVEELARTLHGEVAIAWGRCWEEGGAPPYWPWTQALRALARKREIDAQSCLMGSRAPWLAQLVPELADRIDGAPPRVEPDVSRFRLHDAVVGALSDIAEQNPLLIIFEDLHAADTSSIELVEFLARQIRSTRIALIGTLREAEARRGPCQVVLERIERDARCLALHRLDQRAVESYLEGVLGRSPSASLARAMMQASEGNPLFLSEIVRRQSALDHMEREGMLSTVPRSIQAAIADRIAELTPATRALLEIAAAFGREVSGELLLHLSGDDRSTLFASLAEAIDHAVLIEAAPDLFRFSHILVRETIHERTAIERRCDLHLRVAQTLEEQAEVVWSTVAQHYLLGGQPARGAALIALRRAAEQAERALAFAEASSYYQRALELDPTERARCELSLGLASTLRHVGKVSEARRASETALEVARRLSDHELFALAALEHGGVLEVGATSDTLIELLEQALDRFEPGDSAIRARVMARLAAAQQPCPSPEIPFELARRAISMARRVHREHDLLETLRVAISALMDLADPRERMALNREHIALAERLDAPLDVLLAQGRLALDAAELGEPGTLTAAVASCARLVERHELAHHRWRVSLLEGMCATKVGRFEAAEALSHRASSEAEHASEPWAMRSIQMQRHLRARLRGDYRRAIEILDELEPLLQGFEFGRHMATLLRTATLAGAGKQGLAASLFDEELVRWPLAIGDLSLLELAAEAALAKDDHRVMERLLARIRPEAHRFISWGILGAAIGPPASAIVGRLLVALGKEREGEQHLREAWAKAQATSSAPQAAWIAFWIARVPGARDRRTCAEEALRAAEALSMPGLAEQAQAVLHELSSAPKTATGVELFSMRSEGGLWIFECGGRSFHLRDRRGLRLLSRLVENPRRAFHVLDLESPLGANPEGGGSDAGEMLDARAREAYRKRVEVLRDELAEAERWNDTYRAERARAELDAIAGELARAVGLGGRTRRSASQVERARVNVQRRLKDAIIHIATEHPELAKHLERAVRTGTFCSYEPD